MLGTLKIYLKHDLDEKSCMIFRRITESASLHLLEKKGAVRTSRPIRDSTELSMTRFLLFRSSFPNILQSLSKSQRIVYIQHLRFDVK